MGRSKLTPTQEQQIAQRLASGERGIDLAKEFKVSKSWISQRFSKPAAAVKDVANQLVGAESALRALPVAEQLAALNLADELRAISMHLASAAKYGSATSHRLAALAHSEVAKIDDANPLSSMEALWGVSALTRLANDSGQIGLNLLAANKEAIKDANARAGAPALLPSSVDEFV